MGSTVTGSSVQTKPTSGMKPLSSQSVGKPSGDSHTAASALIHSSKPSAFHSAAFHATSDEDDSQSSSVGVGRAGSKFLKKRVQSVVEMPDVQANGSAAVEKSRQLNCCMLLINYRLLTALFASS